MYFFFIYLIFIYLLSPCVYFSFIVLLALDNRRFLWYYSLRLKSNLPYGSEYLMNSEKYSRGRRGVPAKDVGRDFPAREFKSLLLRQKDRFLPVFFHMLWQSPWFELERRLRQGRASKNATGVAFLRRDGDTKQPFSEASFRAREKGMRLSRGRSPSNLSFSARKTGFLPVFFHMFCGKIWNRTTS